MADLAVVVVTWNVQDIVLAALQSLIDDLQQSDLKADIYVVDSASSDGTPEAIEAQFPEVHLTVCDQNLGFGRANNLALRQMGFDNPTSDSLPKAVYLLNCDTITQSGATRELFDTLMAHPDWGLVGARLTYGDGTFQHSAFTFPDLRQLWVELFPTPGRLIDSPFNGRYPHQKYESNQPFAVDFVLGATMMLRREVIQETGMFDEQFFMYCEEIDWAWRIQKARWGVYCVPTAHVIHLGGQSTLQVRPRSIMNLWTSRLRLFAKHYPRWKNRIARWMIRIGMWRNMQLSRRLPRTPDLDTVIEAYRTIYNRAMKGICD